MTYFAGTVRTNRVNVKLGGFALSVISLQRTCVRYHTNLELVSKSSDFGIYSGERQSYYQYSSLYQEADQYEVLYTNRTTRSQEKEEPH